MISLLLALLLLLSEAADTLCFMSSLLAVLLAISPLPRPIIGLNNQGCILGNEVYIITVATTTVLSMPGADLRYPEASTDRSVRTRSMCGPMRLRGRSAFLFCLVRSRKEIEGNGGDFFPPFFICCSLRPLSFCDEVQFRGPAFDLELRPAGDLHSIHRYRYHFEYRAHGHDYQVFSVLLAQHVA